MEKLRCHKCGKFMGEKDLLNCETKRLYDWDGIPLEDVFMHRDCDLAGGKKVEASESNCTIHGVSSCAFTEQEQRQIDDEFDWLISEGGYGF